MLLSVKKERVQNIFVNQGGHGLIYLYPANSSSQAAAVNDVQTFFKTSFFSLKIVFYNFLKKKLFEIHFFLCF
jgi:hypothetical protein